MTMVNKQREVITSSVKQYWKENIKDEILSMLASFVEDYVQAHTGFSNDPEEWTWTVSDSWAKASCLGTI